jgi:hypothetical protein
VSPPRVHNPAHCALARRCHGPLGNCAGPLILSTNLTRLSPELLAVVGNADVVMGVNQDPLGVQARKLAIDDALLPALVGLEPCRAEDGPPGSGSPSRQTFAAVQVPSTAAVAAAAAPRAGPSFAIQHPRTRRCLSVGTHAGVPAGTLAPLLVECNASDALQAWMFDRTIRSVGSVVNVGAAAAPGSNATALAVAASTAFSALHGQDTTPLSDTAYGTTLLRLEPLVHQPSCTTRSCEGYDPRQVRRVWNTCAVRRWLQLHAECEAFPVGVTPRSLDVRQPCLVPPSYSPADCRTGTTMPPRATSRQHCMAPPSTTAMMATAVRIVQL